MSGAMEGWQLGDLSVTVSVGSDTPPDSGYNVLIRPERGEGHTELSQAFFLQSPPHLLPPQGGRPPAAAGSRAVWRDLEAGLPPCGPASPPLNAWGAARATGPAVWVGEATATGMRHRKNLSPCWGAPAPLSCALQEMAVTGRRPPG